VPQPQGPVTDRDRDGEVPQVPRGRLFRLTGPDMFRVGLFSILLLAVIMLRKPCSDGVARFVGTFDPPPDAGAAAPAMHLEHLSEDEIRQRFPGGFDAGPGGGETKDGQPEAPPSPAAPSAAPATEAAP
jgi:hypothetical protein